MTQAHKSHSPDKEYMKEEEFFQYKAPNAEQLVDGDSALGFITAGNAKITIKSLKTGKHYTYKVRRSDSGMPLFVSRLTIRGDYLYQGSIFEEGFRSTKKTSPYARLSEGFLAFKWLWDNLSRTREIPRGVEVYHAGKCGACGKELTNPLSISLGYGPDCLRGVEKRKLKI
jgi:hypothetical protein